MFEVSTFYPLGVVAKCGVTIFRVKDVYGSARY